MINSRYTVRYGFDAKESEFCRSTRQDIQTAGAARALRSIGMRRRRKEWSDS